MVQSLSRIVKTHEIHTAQVALRNMPSVGARIPQDQSDESNLVNPVDENGWDVYTDILHKATVNAHPVQDGQRTFAGRAVML